MNYLYKIISNPIILLAKLWESCTCMIKSDRLFLSVDFFLRMGYKLNLKNPLSYSEKLQWLKLYDRNPFYTKLVDKYAVKEYVKEKIGIEHIIPTLGIYSAFDEIVFDDLPNEFVLKTTHDSGTVIICKDKAKFDYKLARKKLERSLKTNFYNEKREWPYKNVPPRILVEQFMVDESGTELKDYKIFCFNGIPRIMFIATDRPHDTRFDFYDMNFNHLPFTNGHPNADRALCKPKGFDDMLNIAEILSANIPHVRIDLYDINGTIYFGEMTFFHWSGLQPFNPREWDYKLGEMLDLPIVSE